MKDKHIGVHGTEVREQYEYELHIGFKPAHKISVNPNFCDAEVCHFSNALAVLFLIHFYPNYLFPHL